MRLMQIFEAGDTTVLYRGDGESIDSFSMDKTDREALVGSGIYLTSDKTVARDYTIKDNDVLYKSDRGASDDPRWFLQQEFDAIIQPLYRPVYEAYTWGVSGGMRDISQYIAELTQQRRNTAEEDYAQAYAHTKAYELFKTTLRGIYDREYVKFKQSFEGTRMMSTVLGELVVMKEVDIGFITQLDIPTDYVDQTYKVDSPMTPDVMKWLFSYVEKLGLDPHNAKMDLRYTNDDGDEVRADSIAHWIKLFKTHECRFAWGDIMIGNKGEYPSVLEFLLGTHAGNSIMHSDNQEAWESLKNHLSPMGHTGFHYEGGKRTGNYTWAGGSPTMHDAYSFWDANKMNSFIVANDQIGINATNPKLFARFQFRSSISSAERMIKQLTAKTKLRNSIEHAEFIEARVDGWLATGELRNKLLAAGRGETP